MRLQQVVAIVGFSVMVAHNVVAGESSDSGKSLKSLSNKHSGSMFFKTINNINHGVYNLGRSYTDDNGKEGEERTSGNAKALFIKNYKEIFCNPLNAVEIKGLQCVGKPPNPITTMGPIRIDNLIGVNKISTELQEILAEDVVRNLVFPFPSNDYRDLLLDDEGKAKEAPIENRPQDASKLADKLTRQATFGAAYNSLNNMLVSRLSGERLGLDGSDKDKSFMEVLENEATRRFTDPSFHSAMESASQTVLTRELLQIEAFKVYLDYQRFKQNERIESLLAVMLAGQAKQNESTNSMLN